MTEQRGIQSIEVGGQLLHALAHAGRPLALKDLAREADMTPAKAHPYLVSFGAVGLVEEDHELPQVHVVRDWCYLGSVERPEDAATLARACELGVAMQFTNIARDVGEDARAGRLYLPRSWMREAGLDPDSADAFCALIRSLHRELGLTVVMVTHELPSIFAVADRCVYLDAVSKTMIALGDPATLRDSGPPPVREFLTRGAAPTPPTA